MSAVPVARPWRKCLRFSVRGLIVVVLLVGGWFGWEVRSARIQREAVAAITKAGTPTMRTAITATAKLENHSLLRMLVADGGAAAEGRAAEGGAVEGGAVSRRVQSGTPRPGRW